MDNIIRTEKIDITPDISLYPKIGKSGYTLTQSLAELVDNSIDARILNKTITINIFLSNNAIEIEDNGSGMTREIAEKAVVLGYSKKQNALGEFGLGLKSACTSLGKIFTLQTHPLGQRNGYKYQYDEKKWTSKQDKSDWTSDLLVIEKDPNKHGTLIKIELLTRRVNKQRKKEILDDFSKRFAPFIKTEEAKIFVNQQECKPEDPDLTDEGKSKFEITTENGSKIFGWFGLMKKGSDKGLYGFNTFRRGRMITSFDKIGIPHHPTVSRIIGEIHLDHVPVSHNKMQFETESEEYKKAVKLLEKEFTGIVRKARESTLTAKITKEVKDRTDVWKGAIIKAFFKDKDLFDLQGDKTKRSFNERDPIGSVIIEKRDSPLNKAIREIVEKRQGTRSPRDKRQVIISHFIKIKGKEYTINHDFAKLGEDTSWKEYSYLEDMGTIEIFTNQDFPAYATTKDVSFYAAIHISETIAEIIVKVNKYDYEKVDEIKQRLLRGASKIIEEFN